MNESIAFIIAMSISIILSFVVLYIQEYLIYIKYKKEVKEIRESIWSEQQCQKNQIKSN